MKRFLPIGVVIVGLLVILFVFRRCASSGSASYQTATVAGGPITQLVTATGTLNPVTNVQVGSQVSGNIQKLFADFNSEVKAGQTALAFIPRVKPPRSIRLKRFAMNEIRNSNFEHSCLFRVSSFGFRVCL
jgi:multidrug efflux pump subunit AcrA (membrane-fusion protein)